MNRSASTTGRGRRLAGAFAAGAVAAAVSLAGAPAAFAANDYLEFSLDGKTYAPSVSGDIFTDALDSIPGAAVDATIWVRNTSGEPAWLSSAAVMVRSDPELNQYMGLTAGLAPDFSVRSVLGSQGSCNDVSQIWDLSAGEELELTFVVDMSLDAPNETMNRAAAFDIVFLLASKDAARRSACDALGDSDRLAAGPDKPNFPTPDRTAGLVTLPGTGGPAGMPAAAASNGIWTAGTPGSAPAAHAQVTAPREEQVPNAIVPAGVFSTVEPIIRSLSGTLLIAVSVLFAAAVVARVREGRYE